MMTLDEMNEILEFDPSVNHFRWKINSKHRKNMHEIAGHHGTYGYWIITIDYKNYHEHQLLWLYHYGEWPIHGIDHKNRIKHDNRIENLRLATTQQNSFNKGARKGSKTGEKNIYVECGKFRVRMELSGKTYSLGFFTDIQEAITTRDKWCREHHGEFFFKESELA